MASTYTPIATYTANGSQTSITFNSFSGYTDLVLISAGNSAAITAIIRFNGDTGTNYSRTIIRGNGSTADSVRQSNQDAITLDGSYSQPGQNFIVHIMNYSNSTTYKTTLQRSNNASAGLDQGVGLWRNTAAITSLEMRPAGATPWTSGTTFTLYGIKAA